MMQVLVFELGGERFALKLAAVDRILAPGEPLPAGCRRRWRESHRYRSR